MIEVTVKDIVDNAELMRSISQKSLNCRPAFLLARILREMEKEYQSFLKVREQVIKKYAKRADNGDFEIDDEGNFKIDKTKIEEFNTNIRELLETKVPINVSSIALSDLEDTTFTPQEMMVLESFISE